MPTINKAKVIEQMAKKEILTYTELAEALGISRTQLSNILSEKFEPIKSNVVELAEFLEISPLELIKESSKEK
jgi:DNA (cytosine-5)-methyltransferase 1